MLLDDASVDLYRKTQHLIDDVVATLESKGIVDQVAYFTMVTMLGLQSSHRGVWLLCQAGLGVEACVLSRRVFEIALNYKYVCLDPRQHVTQFLDYAFVDFWKKTANSPQHRTKDMSLEYERVKLRYRGRDWTEKTVEERARLCGWAELYESIYRQDSSFVHGSALTGPAYTVCTDGEIKIREEQDPRLIFEGILGSSIVLLSAIGEQRRVSGLPRDPLLSELFRLALKGLSRLYEMNSDEDSI